MHRVWRGAEVGLREGKRRSGPQCQSEESYKPTDSETQTVLLYAKWHKGLRQQGHAEFIQR